LTLHTSFVIVQSEIPKIGQHLKGGRQNQIKRFWNNQNVQKQLGSTQCSV